MEMADVLLSLHAGAAPASNPAKPKEHLNIRVSFDSPGQHTRVATVLCDALGLPRDWQPARGRGYPNLFSIACRALDPEPARGSCHPQLFLQPPAPKEVSETQTQTVVEAEVSET